MSPFTPEQSASFWLAFAVRAGSIVVPEGAPALPLAISDMIIDPLRVQELVNAEFRPDGSLAFLTGEFGESEYRYDALPAAAAAEPTAFGCCVVEFEGHSRSPALVAISWDGLAVRFHGLSPVVVRTSTVAEAGGASSASGGGLSH